MDFVGPYPSQGYSDSLLTLTRLVQQVAKPGMLCLEVGSWVGYSSYHIGKIVQKNNGLLFCVDWWRGSEGVPELLKAAEANDIFSYFQTNIRNAGLVDVVLPLKMRSEQAALILKDGIFDLIYIDGCHLYQEVKKDIALYQGKVKSPGILCGHDCLGKYENLNADLIEGNLDKNHVLYSEGRGCHPGVVKAVHEAFQNYEVENEVWWIKKDGVISE